MLQYVLEFVATKPAVALPAAQDSQTTPLQSQTEPCVSDTLSQPNGLVNRSKNSVQENTLPFSPVLLVCILRVGYLSGTGSMGLGCLKAHTSFAHCFAPDLILFV